MKKKLISILLAVALCVSCVAVTTLSASAATGSYDRNTRTIIVSTKSSYWYPGSSSITLSQSKGTVTYSKVNLWGKVTGTGTAKYYGTWNIQVTASDGSHSFSKRLTGGSIKLNLKPDKTYYITVSYDWNAETFIMIKHKDSRWSTLPSWRVSGTWKVASYS